MSSNKKCKPIYEKKLYMSIVFLTCYGHFYINLTQIRVILEEESQLKKVSTPLYWYMGKIMGYFLIDGRVQFTMGSINPTLVFLSSIRMQNVQVVRKKYSK